MSLLPRAPVAPATNMRIASDTVLSSLSPGEKPACGGYLSGVSCRVAIIGAGRASGQASIP